MEHCYVYRRLLWSIVSVTRMTLMKVWKFPTTAPQSVQGQRSRRQQLSHHVWKFPTTAPQSAQGMPPSLLKLERRVQSTQSPLKASNVESRIHEIQPDREWRSCASQ